MVKYLAVFLVLSGLAFAGKHAPLPAELMNAKTLYIDNQSGSANVADKCYDELSKWGRFKLVSDPAHADIVLRVGTHTTVSGYSGQTTSGESGTMNTSVSADRAGFTTIALLGHDGSILWSDTRSWGNLFTGFKSATRSVIKELRQRMEEQ